MLKTFTYQSILCAIIACLTSASVALGQNWPRFRGPNGTGEAEKQNIPAKLDKNSLVWKVAIPGKGNSSPVIWGKKLFLQTASNNGDQRMLLCLNAEDGKTIWTKTFPGVKTKTHNKNTLASSTPATDGKHIVTVYWDGVELFLVAYDMAGKRLWTRELGGFKSKHGFGASPVIYGDNVYFANDQIGKAVVTCFDVNTGKPRWSKKREPFRPCYSAPFMVYEKGKAPQLIVTNTLAVTSYHPQTGKVHWNWKWVWPKNQKPLRTTGSSIVADGIIVASGGDGGGDRGMVAISIDGTTNKPTVAWSNNKDFPYVPTPLVRGEHIYLVSDKGYAGCFVAKTGEKVWYKRIADTYFTSSPVLIDGRMYAPSEQGNVFVFAAEPEYELIETNHHVNELFRATPAVANGRLYIRGAGHLYCYGKK